MAGPEERILMESLAAVAEEALGGHRGPPLTVRARPAEAIRRAAQSATASHSTDNRKWVQSHIVGSAGVLHVHTNQEKLPQGILDEIHIVGRGSLYVPGVDAAQGHRVD